MSSTVAIVAGSLITLAVIAILVGLFLPQVPGASQSAVEGPADITGLLGVQISTAPIPIGVGFMDIIVGYSTYVALGVKNQIVSKITVNRIAPMSQGFSAVEIFPPIELNSYQYAYRVIPVPWLRMSGFSTRVYPGDVVKFSGGILEKEQSGAVFVNANGVPILMPQNYNCPFVGNQKYNLSTYGTRIEALIENPGCAPTEIVNGYTGNKMLVVSRFSVVRIANKEFDIPLYVHIYGSAPGSRDYGFYYRGSPDSGNMSLITLYKNNPDNPKNYEVSPSSRNPTYAAYWIDASASVEQLFTGDNRTAAITRAGYIDPRDIEKVAVGIARTKPVKNAVYVAYIPDDFHGDSFKQQLTRVIDILKKYNSYLALQTHTYELDLNGQVPVYSDMHVTILFDFTNDFDKILRELKATAVREQCCGAGPPGFNNHVEPYYRELYIAATKLSWDDSSGVVRIILMRTTGENPYCDCNLTLDQILNILIEKGIKVYIIKWSGSPFPAEYVANKTGGKVLPDDVNSFENAIKEIYKDINFTPTYITTDLPAIGVFRDRILTIKGLYPGDRILISSPLRVKTLTANQTTEVIDLLSLFTPMDLAESIRYGGLSLVIQPSPYRLLDLLPRIALVHVMSINQEVYIQVPLLMKPENYLKAEINQIAVVNITRFGELFIVYILPPNEDPIAFGAFPKVYVKNMTNYTITFIYTDGTSDTYSYGSYATIGNASIYLSDNLSMLLVSDRPGIATSAGAIETPKPVKTILIKGKMIINGYLGK